MLPKQKRRGALNKKDGVSKACAFGRLFYAKEKPRAGLFLKPHTKKADKSAFRMRL